jgi:diaminopimelate epimerase
MKININYMSGAGNLFTVIDNREYNFEKNKLSELAVLLCNLDFKTEGLLVLNESKDTDFSVLFYNPDGTSDMMCGNGGRCAIFFAAEMRIFKNKEKVQFEMSDEIYEGLISHNAISLFLPPPFQFKSNQNLLIDNNKITYSYSDVGSKHCIIDYESIFGENKVSSKKIKEVAKKVRYHEKFEPEGINVNFFRLINDEVHLKTFEKGVEDITGACGTGAVSTAIHLRFCCDYPDKIKIIPPSGIPLEVEIVERNNMISRLILTGHAEIIKTFTIDV